MTGDTPERCWLCSFWNGDHCTQTWRLIIHVEPTGGQVDFSTTPGMVPEHLKEKVGELFGRMATLFLLPLIEKMPIWEEIREYQLANRKERSDCPAREQIKGIEPYLHIVRTPT
jgi:hypothetical protein